MYNVGNNTLVIPKLNVNLKTKNKYPKNLQNKNFSTNPFAQMITMVFKIG